MEKKCKTCGTIVPNEVNFCTACGGTAFETQDFEETGILNETPQNIVNQQPNVVNQQPWQPPAPQPQPQQKTKNGHKGLIITIIVIAVLVLAVIGFTAEKIFQSQGYGQSSISSSQQTSSVAYTKGTFDGTKYVNEWADIAMELPYGFLNADSETYSSFESENLDCGMCYTAEDTTCTITISYEELPSFPIYDEDSYLDDVVKGLEASPLDYQTTNITYVTKTLSKYIYRSLNCDFKNTYGTFTHSIYVRKLDNRMILISVFGLSSEANDALVNQITTVN